MRSMETEDEVKKKPPLLPGQIRIELVYNPQSLTPYEVHISDKRHSDSEDSFKTLQGAYAYMDWLMHLKQDYKIIYTDKEGKKHKKPMWVTFSPRFQFQYEEVGSWRSKATLFTKQQYHVHREFLKTAE